MDKELFRTYVLQLINDLPQSVYEGTTSAFCIGAVVLIVWKGIKEGVKCIALLAWIEYVFLLYCSTVFCRVSNTIREFNFYPLWSYRAIENGRNDLVVENIMNVVVFIPVGLLIEIALPRLKWWNVWLIGLLLAVGIEALQFIFMRGFSEVDDVMHNTMGCVIGFKLACILMCFFRKLKIQ